MPAVSVRNLDAGVKERLRVRAASNGRSMEAEIRAILIEAVSDPRQDAGLFANLLQRIQATGGAELDLPRRSTSPWSPDLSS